MLGYPSASVGRAEKKHLVQKATRICSAICLPIRPVFSALAKETKENADRAPASANESFPWAEWMPSPVQPPGQHQHWVNTETNLCEIKTHFYMVPWHQDRRFLPTKQAQLSCYALWPSLFNEKVVKSLNSSSHGKQETKKSGVHASWKSRKWAVLPNAKNTGTRAQVFDPRKLLVRLVLRTPFQLKSAQHHLTDPSHGLLEGDILRSVAGGLKKCLGG